MITRRSPAKNSVVRLDFSSNFYRPFFSQEVPGTGAENPGGAGASSFVVEPHRRIEDSRVPRSHPASEATVKDRIRRDSWNGLFE